MAHNSIAPATLSTSVLFRALVPGAKLVRADVGAHYPDGRLKIYQYYSDDPQPRNLLDFVWIKDMAHAQVQGEAQMEWHFFKHWSRNDIGSLTYAP